MLTPTVNPLPVNYYAIDPGPVREQKRQPPLNDDRDMEELARYASFQK